MRVTRACACRGRRAPLPTWPTYRRRSRSSMSSSASTSACPRCVAGRLASKVASTMPSIWAAASATPSNEAQGPKGPSIPRTTTLEIVAGTRTRPAATAGGLVNPPGEVALEPRQQQDQLRLLHRRQHLADVLDPIVVKGPLLGAVGQQLVERHRQTGVVGMRCLRRFAKIVHDDVPLGGDRHFALVVA